MLGNEHFPSLSTTFIGREREITEIGALLSQPTCRLLTLVGPGGIGKTRLALEVASHQTSRFADGIIFVPLAPISSADNIPTAIAGAFNIRLDANTDAAAQILTYLRDKTLLLVLDNFEHVLDGAHFVGDILRTAPGVQILATSREPLNLQDEWLWQVKGLPFPKDEDATQFENYDAVQLFEQRAKRVQNDFDIQKQAPDVVRICQLVEGMPLAVELAAGWLKTLTCRQIGDEIQRNLDILVSPARDAPSRHRSIRAVFDHSWNLLTDEQQSVFRRLSVFRGGFTLESAQKVAGASLWMLASLVDKSMLKFDNIGRYDIHELLRQYGEEKLAVAGEVDSARDAHSTYFLDFLAARLPDVKGRRQRAAIDEIDADFENIRVAWVSALAYEQIDTLDHALECLVIVGEITGRLLDTQWILQQSANSLAIHKLILWERIIVRLAHLNFAVRNDANFELVKAILRRARERNDVLEVIWCLWILADYEVNINGGDNQALSLYEELVMLCRTTGNDYYCAHGLVGLAWRYANNSEALWATECFREAIAIRQKIGDVKNLDYATSQLSWITFDHLQDAKTAEALLDERISIQQGAGTISFLPLLLSMKAMMAFWRNDVDAAQKLAQKGLDLSHNHNYYGGKNVCQGVLGLIENYYGNYKQAQVLCQEIVSLGFSNLTAFLCHWGLSLANYGLGNEAWASRNLTDAMQIACRYKSPTFLGLCLLLAAVVSDGRNNPQEAIEYLAFNFSQPPHLTGWLHNWLPVNRLRAKLETKFSLDDYAAIWALGTTLDLEATVRRILDEAPLLSTNPHPIMVLRDALTERELEVLHLLERGYTNSEISDKLIISVSTVKVHIRHIFNKLDVENRTQAVVRARELNLL